MHYVRAEEVALTMDVGVVFFPTDLSIRPDRLAVALEERGFESFWVTEHTHIPTSRATPWPGGAELPMEYKRTLDPFVALGAAAAVTTRLKLATGISLVAQHHPINLAKSVASLDLVSKGRFLFGIGVGWNVDEMQHHGVEPSTRRRQVREHILAMKQLWTEEEASFEGEFVNFSSSWSWPKPVQWPHPPVVMGGAGGPVTFKHIVEYCDGWMPIAGRKDIAEKMPLLRSMLTDAGRDADAFDLGIFACPPKRESIDGYAELGATRVAFALPSASEDVVLPLLDRWSELI
jgi:probable F420-dependent oxidoreductase